MASSFRTKHGVVPVNIEFDGLKKKKKKLAVIWVGRRRPALVNCALVPGTGAGGLQGAAPELAGGGVWQSGWLWQF